MLTSARLSEDEARLRAVLDSLQEGVVTADASGMLVDWNPAALRLHGYAGIGDARQHLSECVDTFELSTLDGEPLPLVEWPMARVLRGESFSAWEVRVRRKDSGLEKVFSYSGTPVVEDGEVRLAVLTLQDVTERKQAEEALRQSEAELRDFVENATVGLHWVGPDGTILWANRTELELLGYERDEYVGRHIAEFHADPPVIEEILSTLCGGETLINREARLRGKDGSIRHVLISSNVLFDGQTFVRTRCFTRDVTERKRFEDAWRESSEMFSALADNIDQLAWMAHADGSIYWYNRRWYEYTGTTPDQMEGWGWQSVHDPEVLPAVMERWQRSLESGQSFDMEFPLRGADGTFRPFLTRIHPVKDAEGRIVRWFGSNTDVSEHRRAQDELRGMKENLERLVQERTEGLMRANEQLQGFTYSVAHDFRQHIRNVNVNAAMILEDEGDRLNEDVQARLKRIASESRLMSELTSGLLEHARLSNEDLRVVDVDLSALASEVVKRVVEKPYCGQGAQFLVAPGLLAKGDPRQLRLVLDNLIDNACKYAKRDQPVLVEVGSRSGAFFVRDNGIGFDPAFSHKLFQPFERLHSGAGYEGTGIGLANVKRIVERHGGRVWAESEPGKGATFYFTLAA
jgi:PAS domain S-box-containing protein